MTHSAYTTAELDAKITRVKATITIIEDQIDAVAAGAQSYSLDTGQTRQSVTPQTLSQLRGMLSYYENRLSALTARRHGGSVVVTPGF